MKIHIRKSANGEYYYTIVARNGKTLCHSENIHQKGSITKSINALKCGLNKAEIVDHTKKPQR